jgi:hypothetical protein
MITMAMTSPARFFFGAAAGAAGYTGCDGWYAG